MNPGGRHAEDGSEDAILARAIGDLGIAVTGETVVWEEALIVDRPLSAAAKRVHAVLAATRHLMLPGLPATSDDQHEISWIAGRGGVGDELSPVLITVSLTVEERSTVNIDRTAIKIRGAAKEERTIKPWSAARTAVDMLMGILGDLFDDYDIVDITGLQQHWQSLLSDGFRLAGVMRSRLARAASRSSVRSSSSWRRSSTCLPYA